MIKKIILIIFFHIYVFSQSSDSLFWFDQNVLHEKLPEFPLIINRVLTGDHIPLIDSMNNKEIGTFEVYRIQIFESSIASIARAEAKRFQNILGDTVYIDFETPLYKLRIGNYTVRKNAEKAIKSISGLGVKDSWIIKTNTIVED
jgi:hypothetical protein